jgi:hypothetical protein
MDGVGGFRRACGEEDDVSGVSTWSTTRQGEPGAQICSEGVAHVIEGAMTVNRLLLTDSSMRKEEGMYK